LPTFSANFVYDAGLQILTGPFLRDPGNWPSVLTVRVPGKDVLDFKRPVHLASLMLDAAAWGRGVHADDRRPRWPPRHNGGVAILALHAQFVVLLVNLCADYGIHSVHHRPLRASRAASTRSIKGPMFSRSS
jgi:hypothetical protein